MANRTEPEELDFMYAAFLKAADEQESDWLLESLIEYARPLIRAIIMSQFRTAKCSQDLDDIAGDAVLGLLETLRRSKSKREDWEGQNIHGLIAVTTYNAYYKYLRNTHPKRTRLKRRLRYILNRQRGFAIWKAGSGEWLCGFESWRHDNRAPCSRGCVDAARNDPQVLQCAERASGPPHGDRTAELLAAIFDSTRTAFRFDDLVDLVADVLKISDKPPVACEELSTLTDGRQSSLSTEVEQRDCLRKLWDEICALPLDQRRALLLNLRDSEGCDAILSIVHRKIASIRQIAEAIAMPAEEFAGMFSQLPLDDRRIGEIIGTTRQRVINLRKAARRRLKRRMTKLNKGR